MQLQVAALCDAASVREGLLFTLGAGISRIFVETFPNSLDVSLAVVVELEQQELGIRHDLEAKVYPGKASRAIARYGGTFQSTAPQVDTSHGLPYTIAFVLRLRPTLPRQGRYRAELAVGPDIRRVLHFWVGPRDESAS